MGTWGKVIIGDTGQIPHSSYHFHLAFFYLSTNATLLFFPLIMHYAWLWQARTLLGFINYTESYAMELWTYNNGIHPKMALQIKFQQAFSFTFLLNFFWF